MHPHQKKIKAVLDAIKNAHKVADSQLQGEDLVQIKLRVQKRLEAEGNYLTSLINGQPFVEDTREEPQAITKLFGKEISGYSRGGQTPSAGKLIHSKTEVPAPDENKLSPEEEELIKEVEELWPTFPSLEPADILDKYSELSIRAIGKKAGLPVTENSPKKVDAKFIDTVKEAIKAKEEADKASSAGKEGDKEKVKE